MQSRPAYLLLLCGLAAATIGQFADTASLSAFETPLVVGSVALKSPAAESAVASANSTKPTPRASSLAPAIAGPERTVTFRDGTVLRMQFPDAPLAWQTVSAEGIVTELPLPFQELNQLDLVTNPITIQIQEIRSLIEALGSPVYGDRVAAHAELIERGKKFRPIISASKADADSEVRWRVEDILTHVKEGSASLISDLDRLERAGQSESLFGEIGNPTWKVSYRGQTIELDRSNVMRISATQPEVRFSDSVQDRTVQSFTDETLFPISDNAFTMAFERDADGNLLEAGADLATAYRGAGAVITTSVPGAIVSAQVFKVRQGLSAATNEPPYTGTVTIRFCMPGNENFPAGVHQIGCFVSYVTADGTILKAFDDQNRLIGQTTTPEGGTAFLGLTSSIPIAYCQIVPVEEIDDNYAFDDFVFDAPQPLMEVGDPSLYTVVLKNGERLQAEQVGFADDQLELIKLSIGLPTIQLAKSEVAVFIPPRQQATPSEWGDFPFARLIQGSTFRASNDRGDGLRISRFISRGPLDPRSLSAIWGAENEPSDYPKSDSAYVWINEQAVELADFRLGSNWISSTSLESQAYQQFTYNDSPFVWLKKPNEVPAGSGILRTTEGETIFLNEDSFQVVSWDGKAITVRWSETEFSVPIGQVRSLRFPHQP